MFADCLSVVAARPSLSFGMAPLTIHICTPCDGVAQQCNECVAFPGAAKNARRGVRGIRASRADGRVVAMSECKICHATVADLPRITEHAGAAVGLQRSVRWVDRTDRR